MKRIISALCVFMFSMGGEQEQAGGNAQGNAPEETETEKQDREAREKIEENKGVRDARPDEQDASRHGQEGHDATNTDNHTPSTETGQQ